MTAEPHPGLPGGLLDALRAHLAEAADVRAAAEVATDVLAAVAGILPSVYVERGGRLRCLASRGYWQVRDGMPPSAGVIGRAYRTGRAVDVPDLAAAGDYLEAASDVVSEICVPLLAGGRVIGVLNVESPQRLPETLIAQLEECAAALGERVDALGGPPSPSAAQRLFSHAARLTGMSTVDEIEREILDAARDVAQMDSAMLLRRDGVGRLKPSRAVGPLAQALYGASPDTIAAIEAFAGGGTCCYTVAQREGGAPHGIQMLREAGACAIVALELSVPGEESGIVLVADSGVRMPEPDEVDLLELLAAQAAACLRTAEAVGELRERAARDPLTGLGHHATFHESLAEARRRGDVAVLLIDVDGFKAINDQRGHQAGDRILVEVAAALSSALRRGDELFRIGGDEFAAIVRVVEDGEAIEAGRRLREAAAAAGTVTVSVGAALPLAGESDAAVLGRADRALYAVKASGRDGVSLGGD